MSSVETQKFAVLAGIDCYSEDCDDENLEGCVGDVEDVSQFLKENPLKIPPNHITTLVAPKPGQQYIENDSKMRPTRAAIIQALKDVTGRARPGDFVYFHFSGHGNVRPTVFGKHKSITPWDEVLKTGTPWREALECGTPWDEILKSGTQSDEVLCATDDDIRDVELGAYLDAMVKKGLLVLVVLDCCYSGGATRGDRGSKIRCRKRGRKRKLATASESENSTKNVTANNTRGSRSTRNATVEESWFYRDREYNVIAACQPHEVAKEHTKPNGSIRGALTYCLIESLKLFCGPTTHHDSTLPITYTTLHGVLESKRLDIDVQQRPMMLGEGNRIVFGAALDPFTRAAIITGTGTESLTLDRGSAHGVCLNDRYKVYRRLNPLLGTGEGEVAEVFINEVRGLHSEAALSGSIGGHLQDIKTGWPAVLVQRASVVHVKVLPTPELSDASVKAAFDYLQQNLQSYNNGIVRFNFRFENDPCETTFQISIDRDCCFEVRNSEGTIMPSIPPLKVDAPEMTERVLDILQHVRSYQMLESLKSRTNFQPKYQFSIEKVLAKREAKSVAAGDGSATQPWAFKRVKFKNLSEVPLFVTLLNLTPAWGVHQIFPQEDPESLAVRPNEEIEPLEIEMVPPKLWKALGTTAPREMRDVLKLIITKEQTSFSHFLLPDLGDSALGTTTPDKVRTAFRKMQVTEDWFVAEEEIISRKEGQS